jgi:hypothetical protein
MDAQKLGGVQMQDSISTRHKTDRQAERRALRPAIVDEHQLYSVDEAAAALDRSRAQLYNDFAAGRILSVNDGKRRKVPGSEIVRVVRELSAAATPSPA